MGTRIDYDEAVENPERTKARLAAGEKLTLVRDGVPFTHLSAPEDLDGFEPRRANPARERERPAVERRTYGYEERARARRRLTTGERWQGILDPPAELRQTLGTPAAQALLADLRGQDLE